MSIEEEEIAPTASYPDIDETHILTQDEAKVEEYHDDVRGMTGGRRVARFLSKFNWYNPNGASVDENGSKTKDVDLDKGWAFFEHQGLPRCLVHKKHRNGGFVRAKRGENKEETKLYSYWATRHRDMSDFGIGVGLYFTTLRFFSLVFLIAGFISIPNMLFLASDDYSIGRNDISDLILRSSAVCTNATFEPCPTCNERQVTGMFKSLKNRMATAYANGETLTFLKVNNCELNYSFGWVSFAIMIFLVVSVYVFLASQRRWIAKFDEGEQTSADYSVRITNPPKDARDPEVWKEFFESKFPDSHVTVCTVVLDNEELLQALAERRTLLRKIENMLPVTETFDVGNLKEVVEKCPPPGCFGRFFCCAKSPESMYERIQDLEKEISELCETDFDVADVFITFETEQAQRKVLEEMNYPLLHKRVVSEDFRFDGDYLYVIEPDEPSSIRWQDLDDDVCKQAKKLSVSLSLSLLLISVGACLIALTYFAGTPSWYSITVIIMNTITPMLVRMISASESHPNQTSKATSMYLKITAFRWTNTVILILVITPFTQTLQDSALIDSIRALYIAELTTRPILQLIDIMGNLRRHFFAPRAPDQRRCNNSFLPSPVSIEERYTDATKIFFLTSVYGVIFPPAYFFTGVIYALGYQMDKFCLLRSWGQGPKINSTISKFSGYFLLACMIIYSCCAAYMFAEFPFDNSCKTGETVSSSYVGTFELIDLNEDKVESSVTIADDSQTVKYCNMDIARNRPDSFPPVPSKQHEWMTDVQKEFTPYFGWTCVAMMILVCTTILIKVVKNAVYPLFCKWYKPVGKATDFKFSKVNSIFGYVPQMAIPGYLFPFILCDVDSIDKQLIGWSAYDESFDAYNLIFDVPTVAEDIMRKREGEDVQKHHIFSTVMSWTP